MVFRTGITRLLGIKYPIILGSMHWITDAKLSSAVSNAGGLGIISSARFKDGDELREEIRKAKQLTDKPLGVNISLNRATALAPNTEFIQAVIEERIPVVETSGVRSPEEVIYPLHAAGIKVIHKVASIKHAIKAEQCGADAVEMVGFANGGNVGMDDVSTMVLVPRAKDVLKIPIIAGGGIADARGFLAALALGAEGVVVGTRFMATLESPVHFKFKQWLLDSQENQTVLVQRSIRNTHRTLINDAVRHVLEMEERGAGLEELRPWISGEKYRRCIIEGRLQEGMAYCGQAVGLINDIPSVSTVVDSFIKGAREIGERLIAMGLLMPS
ncbi:nitronate monooxygenase family protein [Paradesulfitobacterium aromaticivorans]